MNPWYDDCPARVREAMERFAEITGRRYDLFDYSGHPEAERVLILMGSGAETAAETVTRLAARGERVGCVEVRLYRPFDTAALVEALPSSTRRIAVLDRTKEPGAPAEPLFLDVRAALSDPRARSRFGSGSGSGSGTKTGTGSSTDGGIETLIGGRYGLSSKEFTPAMVARVLEELESEAPRDGFTIGIDDDVTHRSLALGEHDGNAREGETDSVHAGLALERSEDPRALAAVFYGLGSDGTVGAAKNTAKIVGADPERHVQAYFVYDSKKAGARTVSHLRFGSREIAAPYLIHEADFVGCHQAGFLRSVDVTSVAAKGATLLVNTPRAGETDPDRDPWSTFPAEMQADILAKGLHVFAIDADRIAREAGLGRRINTILQTCFFALTELVPRVLETN